MSDKFLPTRTLLYGFRHIFISLTSFMRIPNSMRILYKMGGACSEYGIAEGSVQRFGGEHEGKNRWGDAGVDGRII